MKMGIRRVGTPQEEKETYQERQVGIRRRAKAAKELAKREAAKKRGAAALKKAKALQKTRVKKANTKVVKKSKKYA
jgi:hypothetical protein